MEKIKETPSKEEQMTLPGPALELSLQFLADLLEQRLQQHLNQKELEQLELPDFSALPPTPFLTFIAQRELTVPEFLTIILALAPHVQPELLGRIFKSSILKDGDYPEFGGKKDETGRLFLPTGETVLFLMGDDTIATRLNLHFLFDNEHWLRKEQVIQLGPVKPGEPAMNGQLLLDPELVEFFTTGVVSKPVLSTSFPATYITTELAWSDLVLPPQTQREIEEIKIWIEHEQRLMQEWGMKRKIRPGYRALFHGPSGTGKTLTASLLGKETERDVFRIDLSMVISKYIGETEKNLSNLFNKAENKGWILFFDEADALFGKRTEVRDAHDKYANQEVSYLLQRIENYPGLVILASNFKSNIDEAFVRRFESMVHFPMPSEEERLRLWQGAFPKQAQLAKEIDFEKMAMKYELTGGNIMNIVQYVCLQSLAQGEKPIDNRLLTVGIRRELRKEGRLLA